MMWGYDWGWGWVGLLVMILVMVVFWGGIIFLIAWAIRHWSRRPEMYGGGSHALDIARERYARGEISKEEFEGIKKTLQ